MSVEPHGWRAAGGVLLALGCGFLASAEPAVTAGTAVPTTGSGGDMVRFLDGSTLHGLFKGMDLAHGLHWQHPDAKNALDFQPAHLDFLRFTQAQSVSMTASCHFRFASGDDLFGSLVSLNGDAMEFNTWFGGTMKIPRSAVQSITFLARNYTIVYEGPSDAGGWTIGGGRQVQFRMRGMAGVGGVQIYTANDTGAPYWTFHDGAFSSTGGGTLGRDFHLTGSSTIDFDMESSGNLSLLLDLYSSALDRIDYNSSSFLVELDSGPAALRRTRPNSAPNDLGSVTLPEFDKAAKAHITIHCSKEDGAVTVLTNGVMVKQWTELGEFNGVGGGVLFQNQAGDGTLKLSNFKVCQWQGRYEPEVAPTPGTNADFISFVNRDKAGGKIQGIADGKLSVDVGGTVLRIPVERVRQIDFTKSAAAAEPRGGWEVRAVFPGGGSVSFQLEKWDEKTVAGRSAMFGPVAFQPSAIRQMVFNLDNPRPDAARPVENEFETLDQ